MRFGTREPQPRLRQAPLGVDHLKDAGISDGKAAPREIERGGGLTFGRGFGAQLVGAVGKRLKTVGHLAERGQDDLPIAGKRSLVTVDCRPSRG